MLNKHRIVLYNFFIFKLSYSSTQNPILEINKILKSIMENDEPEKPKLKRASTRIRKKAEEPLTPFTKKYLLEFPAPDFSTLHVNFIITDACDNYELEED